MYCPRCMKHKVRQGDICSKCGAKIPNLTGNRKNKGPKNWDQMSSEEHEEFHQAVKEGTEEGMLRGLRKALEEKKEREK